jgi:hypothetical protein
MHVDWRLAVTTNCNLNLQRCFQPSAHIKRQLIRRLCYDASARLNPEDLDLAAGEVRSDVEWIRVQPDVDLKVYWKILPIGKGPAVSLYAFGSRFSGSIVSVRQMAISIFF